MEAIPEILDIKRSHYDLFKKSYPGIEIRSVTSGFPGSELGVGIAHPAFPHEINKIWEIVESEPSAVTKLLWALGLIPVPVSDHWSFVLDVLFCGITLAGLRYHEATNMPFWKIDKYIRKIAGPNPFRAHDVIGAAGANFLSNGTTELYYSDSSVNVVYTTAVTNGDYYFPSVAAGNYKLLAIPDSSESDNYSSTYFGNVIVFNDAYSIPLFANTYSVDIHLQESSGIFDLNSSNSIKIFPNPVIDVLFVAFATDLEINKSVLSVKSVVPFTIFNYQGQKVKYGIIKNNSVKVNKLEDGIYFISFIKDAHYYTSKFIKIN